MAFIPYFVLGPTGLMGLIGLVHGPDRTVPSPQEDWEQATLDVLIPTYNEEKNIVLCLASIVQQTLQPRNIILCDDASSDQTIEYAQFYADFIGIKLTIIQRTQREGKTPALYDAAHASDADVLAVIDGDTILKSDNYLEGLVRELYQGVGIACACGIVLPLTEHRRRIAYRTYHLDGFATRHPKVKFSPDITSFQRINRALSNAYREELYLFLQRFIYRGEMVFFGTLIFPIGCAVTYRRQYLKDILDQYTQQFGFDLTTSEDIFLGFAFAEQGYRTIVVHEVNALTMEPRYSRIYQQLFKWSSSFLQSCYYFDNLMRTPFKLPSLLIQQFKEHRRNELINRVEKRKIKEAYRQSFGIAYTKNYGRPIGWFVFTTAFEKLSFPAFIIIMALVHFWEPLLITLVAEVLLYTSLITFLHQSQRVKNFFKAILFTPIRYSQILFDVVVIARLMIDLWITKNRRWRK
jgi:glycosyltransferase involved in cell wall biosynthesis